MPRDNHGHKKWHEVVRLFSRHECLAILVVKFWRFLTIDLDARDQGTDDKEALGKLN